MGSVPFCYAILLINQDIADKVIGVAFKLGYIETFLVCSIAGSEKAFSVLDDLQSNNTGRNRRNNKQQIFNDRSANNYADIDNRYPSINRSTARRRAD